MSLLIVLSNTAGWLLGFFLLYEYGKAKRFAQDSTKEFEPIPRDDNEQMRLRREARSMGRGVCPPRS